MTSMKDQISAKLSAQEKAYFERLEMLHRMARDVAKSGVTDLDALRRVIVSLERFDEYA